MRRLDSARDCLARSTTVVEVSRYALGCADQEGLLSERLAVACATQAVACATQTAVARAALTDAWPGLAQGIPLPVGPAVVLADLEGKLEGAQAVEVIEGAMSVFRELERAVYYFSVVQEGALVPSSARRWPIGGSDLSERIQRLVLEERQRGGGEKGRGRGGEGFVDRWRPLIGRCCPGEAQGGACEAALDENSFAAARAVEERKEFVLPDGQRISLGPERWDIAEALFRPSLLTHSPLSPPSLEASSLAGPDSAGIVRQLLSVVMDGAGLGGGGGGGGALGGGMGGRAALESIAVVGGGSSLKGLLDRFQSEVQMALPPSLQPTVVRAPEYMPDNTARYAAWYGGAIVARIVFSQNQHVTRAEYNERGPAAVHRKSM
ncbi:hypothetical protein CLOM_g23943 [Closterium sp. NIES-68]|nr:hypothetical protein CLOM_g23943 [Closterium sp. NIES-68]